MRSILVVMATTAVMTAARADDVPNEQWRLQYWALGFTMRAVKACPTDKRAALRKLPPAPTEVQAFAKAFPKTVEGWMTEGAEAFNGGVMRFGLTETCKHVR